jgi:hypothetical protein
MELSVLKSVIEAYWGLEDNKKILQYLFMKIENNSRQIINNDIFWLFHLLC